MSPDLVYMDTAWIEGGFHVPLHRKSYVQVYLSCRLQGLEICKSAKLFKIFVMTVTLHLW